MPEGSTPLGRDVAADAAAAVARGDEALLARTEAEFGGRDGIRALTQWAWNTLPVDELARLRPQLQDSATEADALRTIARAREGRVSP